MKKKILLIDNDTTYLYILKQLLQRHDIVGETMTAKNGSEALDLLKIDFEKGVMPHIIISDIEMPVMNGISFLKELKIQKLVDYTLTRIVLNSNNSSYAGQGWSIENPTVSFFQKPLLNGHLYKILSE